MPKGELEWLDYTSLVPKSQLLVVKLRLYVFVFLARALRRVHLLSLTHLYSVPLVVKHPMLIWLMLTV